MHGVSVRAARMAAAQYIDDSSIAQVEGIFYFLIKIKSSQPYRLGRFYCHETFEIVGINVQMLKNAIIRFVTKDSTFIKISRSESNS